MGLQLLFFLELPLKFARRIFSGGIVRAWNFKAEKDLEVQLIPLFSFSIEKIGVE